MNTITTYAIETVAAPDITAIVLAAGESRRMGKRNKLELELNGQALLRQMVNTLLSSKVNDIIVITGHEKEHVDNLLAGLPVRKIHNADYEQGQMTSVSVGLKQVTSRCDGIMICLADQPLLNYEDIDYLIDAFQQRKQGSIIVPSYQGQRGNPIIFAYEHRQEILQGKHNLGCKRLIDKNPELVYRVNVQNNHFIIDIDTPEDYQALQKILFSEKVNL